MFSAKFVSHWQAQTFMDVEFALVLPLKQKNSLWSMGHGGPKKTVTYLNKVNI